MAHVRIEYRIGKSALQKWVSMVLRYGNEVMHQKKTKVATTKRSNGTTEEERTTDRAGEATGGESASEGGERAAKKVKALVG